jgi:hypothetical protein
VNNKIEHEYYLLRTVVLIKVLVTETMFCTSDNLVASSLVYCRYKPHASNSVTLQTHNCHNSAHYPSSWLLFKTQLNSIGLSVPHRKHIASPLRAQQVNAIYRFVTTVY